MGNHSVAVVLCNGSFATVTTDLAFRNPYGYLPAVYFAHLPFFGFLALSYTTLTVVLGVVLLIRRHIALPLQYAVLGLAVVSLLQYTFAFFVAQTGNETGQPPCCPARAIAVVGVLLGTLRNGLSRGLLLAVCLGFGVVHVRLDKRSTYALVALMALYIFFDANFEINVLVTDDPLEPQFWQLPVLVLDLIFLLYIYSALVNTARNLHEEQQSAKLDMYRWLGRVLGVFVLGTLTVNLVITGAVFGCALMKQTGRGDGGEWIRLFYDACCIAVFLQGGTCRGRHCGSSPTSGTCGTLVDSWRCVARSLCAGG